ncbi:MAG: nuclear transport factor 2 family protein [Solirubrobacterales bacterium]
MSEWSDEFFRNWRVAWNTSTEDIMDLVTDDIEYWDPTLAAPVTNIQDYAVRLDRFFNSVSEANWTQRTPVIFEELEDGIARASESWTFTGINTGALWTGDSASHKPIETIGADVYEFRDGLVCRQYSYFDVLETLHQLGVAPKGSVRREIVTADFASTRSSGGGQGKSDLAGDLVSRGRRAIGRASLFGHTVPGL